MEKEIESKIFMLEDYASKNNMEEHNGQVNIIINALPLNK